MSDEYDPDDWLSIDAWDYSWGWVPHYGRYHTFNLVSFRDIGPCAVENVSKKKDCEQSISDAFNDAITRFVELYSRDEDELAGKLGVSISCLKGMKNGSLNPTMHTIKILSSIGVSFSRDIFSHQS